MSAKVLNVIKKIVSSSTLHDDSFRVYKKKDNKKSVRQILRDLYFKHRRNQKSLKKEEEEFTTAKFELLKLDIHSCTRLNTFEKKIIFIMSVIGVRGMPFKITLQKLIRKLAHVLNCQFEAFQPPHKTSIKTYYLKLPEKLDPFQTINLINGAKFPFQMEAFMPFNNTNIKATSKRIKKIPKSLRKALQIPPNFSSEQLIKSTHRQIMIEMLSKFTQLYELSKTTNHQLLCILWQIMCQRLKDMQTTTASESCFGLSQYYRKKYMHSKDFELIRDVFIKIQKNKGIDFEEINEKEFCSYNHEDKGIENALILGNEKLDTVSNRYSDRIISKIMDHLQNFDTDVRPNNQQDLMRAEVRQHINNMAPSIPIIVRTIVRNNLMKKTFSKNFEVFRIYGEPFLPNKEVMNPFLKKTGYINIKRSETIFNLYTIKIPITNYLNFLKFDGTIICGARLVIRPLMIKTRLTQLKEIEATSPEINIDVKEYCR